MLKINEIFYSLQLEGRNTGMPAIFIRFSGCNLRCSFCDTKHQYGRWMTIKQVLRRLECFKRCKSVVITGGESTIQNVDELAYALQRQDYCVCIETNGTNSFNTGLYDWVTISPKTSVEKLAIRTCDEVKVIYQGQPIKHWLKDIDADYYYLQPCSMKNIKETVNAVKRNPQWRLSCQVQRLINIK